MEMTIKDSNGKIITKSNVKSMNHYLMLLNKLEKKKESYQVLFKDDNREYTRAINIS